MFPATQSTISWNSQWHKPALLGFAVIVLAHWGEHLVQAYHRCDGLAAGEGGRDIGFVVSVAHQVGSIAIQLCVGDAYWHLGFVKGLREPHVR